MHLKTISLLLLLLLLSSCATDIDFAIPLNRFDSPETTGKLLKGTADIHYHSSHKVTLAEVFDSVIFSEAITVNTDSSIEKSGMIGAKASVGIIKRLDVFYKAHYDAPDTVGAKVQIIGAPRIEKKDGFKLAVSAAYGRSTNDEGTIEVSNSSKTQTRKYTSEITNQVVDYSIILGYRFQKDFLVYATGFNRISQIDAQMKSTEFAEINISGDARTWGAMVGLIHNISEIGHIAAEGGYARSSWDDNNKIVSYPIGASIGFSW